MEENTEINVTKRPIKSTDSIHYCFELKQFLLEKFIEKYFLFWLRVRVPEGCFLA